MFIRLSSCHGREPVLAVLLKPSFKPLYIVLPWVDCHHEVLPRLSRLVKCRAGSMPGTQASHKQVLARDHRRDSPGIAPLGPYKQLIA